jgi:hypothetical protein
MRKKWLVVAILLFAQPVYAVDNPKFIATCKDVMTHGYRLGTDIAGIPMEETWSTDEHFNLTWIFQYEGGDYIFIDGKRGRVLAHHPGVLIVSDMPSSNEVGASVWIYAIQLGMRKIVASQVNAYGGFESPMRGVKARSTNLACQFEFN